LVLAGVSVMMIFVMGILAAIMLPALARAREAARQASCSNNLKQFGLVHKMFASDQRGGMFPELSSEPGRLMFTLEPTDGGATVYPEYLSDLSMFVCQSDLDASLIQEGVDAGDAYFYLGYVVTNDAEMATFAEAYSAIVAEGGSFLDDIPVDEGAGSFGSDQLFRLREGIERFSITDINNAGSAAMLQSEIPIMIERPDNHHPYGGNVLYMDGHVEYKQYPGEWPMTYESIDILEELDALGY
jgi:prepilin-type processing-associated H-X9-DG protein